ncbi:uncharacterized protein LOC108913387 [Anoplophora glabripennis]|uniref:uncharacterized protein LOC108913387 n=1 Tax=Anoplophora glabripennis TaxID=217634 RepID=UPI0008757109|nr:uncharacterized protein LOC108913387 [Anoplophora glabripennis]
MLVPNLSAVNRQIKRVKRGSGFLNTLINKLPIELHIPGYNFCGPGTKLEKRLARGDTGINPLDNACLAHDISYSDSSNIEDRHKADRILEQRAWERVKSKDASFGEKTAAWAVANAMKVKTKLGMGLQKKKKFVKRKRGQALSFNQAVQKARQGIRGKPSSNLGEVVKQALSSIGTKRITRPRKRIIPIPKTGGFLPLIPLFAALGALGSIGGGAAGIAKAVNDAKAAKEKMEEEKRHNLVMEQAALGKGLYLRPYRKGMGLYLPSKNSQ